MNDEDLAREALTLDPARSNIVLFLGMKGRGKSTAARMLFDAWPTDRLVIDPTGNAKPDDPDTIAMAAPFPAAMPEPDEHADPPQKRVTVWARIDPGSHNLAFDQDQAMSMGLHPRSRHKLIWRDEFGLGVSPQRTEPNDRIMLMSSRHYNTSALLVCQRPRYIPTLALQQADIVMMWNLPNPEDRELVAKNCGVSVRLFEREYAENQRRHRHAFVLFDRRNDVLLNCPQLPNITARGPRA